MCQTTNDKTIFKKSFQKTWHAVVNHCVEMDWPRNTKCKGPGIFKQALQWRHQWWYSVRHLSLPRQKHNTSFDCVWTSQFPCPSVCPRVCVCKELAKYLELDQHPNSSIAGSEQLRKTSTCVIAKGSKKDRLHIDLRWRQLGNPRLRRYVDSIERLEIFSLAWMHAMLMWHAQHELWSRSWPMKSQHLGKPNKETVMKRSLKSTFGSYFVELLLRLMQACAQTCDLALSPRSADGVT